MLNNGNKTNCEFTNEIVSYIYDEISASERVKFETHLAACHECTNEFAGISNARLSLFEWRRDEFADLPTPQIVIPYPAKRKVDDENSAGLFAGVRGWLSFANFPVAVAAGLIVCLGLGLLLMSYFGRAENLVASNVDLLEIDTTEKPVVKPTIEAQKPETVVITQTQPSVPTNREVRTVRVAKDRKPKIQNPVTSRNQTNPNVTAIVSDAPTLSEDFEENGDTSLRLADLFEDDDS